MSIPWHPAVKVIKQQMDIIAVSKPAGLISHPNQTGCFGKNSLLFAPYYFDKEAYKVASNWLYLLNRLDAPTSGLVLLTTKESVTRQVRTLFREHQITKIYRAILKGKFLKKQLTWEDYLQVTKNEQQHLRTYCQNSTARRGLLSKTILHTEACFDVKGQCLTQVSLNPQTGRTHQLRVQCASHQHPILGDKTYGHFAWNRLLKAKHLCLHAQFIAFNTQQGPFEAEDPCPWSLESVIKVFQQL